MKPKESKVLEHMPFDPRGFSVPQVPYYNIGGNGCQEILSPVHSRQVDAGKDGKF